jgi:hypothetical protein
VPSASGQLQLEGLLAFHSQVYFTKPEKVNEKDILAKKLLKQND